MGNATLAALLLAATLPAQQYIVDLGNSPGTNFTSLATAINTVPSGSTLIVYPGSYSGTHTISGKGLTIVANGPVVVPNLTIQNTLVTQPVVVSGIDVQQPAFTFWPAVVDVSGCAGRVLIEGADVTSVTGSPIRVTGSSFVTLRNCTALNACSMSTSYVVLDSCLIRGRRAIYPSMSGSQLADHALYVTNARIELINTSLFGGSGDCPVGCLGGAQPTGLFENKAAVSLNGGTLTARGSSVVAGGNQGAPAQAAIGTGSIRKDTTATVTAGPAVPMTTLALPDVVSTSAAPGGSMSATATCQPGDVLVLLLGLPGSEVALPGVTDSLWVDPLAYVFAAASGNGSATASLPVPPQATMVGVQLMWQGAVLPAVGTLQLSQPSLSIVH